MVDQAVVEETSSDDIRESPSNNGFCDQIAALKDEIFHHERAYLQRKALLEEDLKGHETHYKSKMQILNKKIAATTQVRTLPEQSYRADLAKMQRTLETKVEEIEKVARIAVEDETKARAATVADLQEQILDRDKDIESLFDLVAKQEEELNAAKVQREEIQSEMQNVLVTLHVHFEHLMGLNTQQKEELGAFKETQNIDNEELKRRVGELTTYVDSTQRDISLIQEETAEYLTKNAETQQATREVFEEDMKSHWTKNNDGFFAQVEENSSKIKTLTTLVETVHNADRGAVSKLKESVEKRFEAIDQDLKKMEESNETCIKSINLLRDNVREENEAQTHAWKKGHVNFETKMLTAVEQIVKVQSEVAAVKSNTDEIKITVEANAECWNETFRNMEESSKEMGLDLTFARDEVAGIQNHVLDLEETFSNKLVDVERRLEEVGKAQEDTNVIRSEKQVMDNGDVTALGAKVEETKEQIKAILRSVAHQEADQAAVKANLKTANANNAIALQEVQKNIDGWNVVIQNFAKDMQQKEEGHILAGKEFKNRQLDLEDKFDLASEQLNELAQRIQATENSLDGAGTPEFVGKLMKPWVKQRDDLFLSLNKQAEDLKAMKIQFYASDREVDSSSKKLETMNNTFQSLFQHLASQVKADSNTVQAIKTENEKQLKDVKKIATKWEAQFKTLSEGERNSKAGIESVLQAHSDELDGFQEKLLSWTAKLDRLSTTFQERSTVQNVTQDKVMSAQQLIERRQAQLEKTVQQLKMETAASTAVASRGIVSVSSLTPQEKQELRDEVNNCKRAIANRRQRLSRNNSMDSRNNSMDGSEICTTGSKVGTGRVKETIQKFQSLASDVQVE